MAAPAEHVFDVFTTKMQSWWEPTHHLIPDVTEMIVQPYVGGTITDRNAAGEECTWSRVLAYDPPRRFAFSWDISLQWEIETDHEKCSAVEVTFTPVSPTATRVDLVHRDIERHGQGWEDLRQAVGGDNGWVLVLNRLAEAAAA